MDTREREHFNRVLELRTHLLECTCACELSTRNIRITIEVYIIRKRDVTCLTTLRVDNLARGDNLAGGGQSGRGGGQSGKGTLEPINLDTKSPCHHSLKIHVICH